MLPEFDPEVHSTTMHAASPKNASITASEIDYLQKEAEYYDALYEATKRLKDTTFGMLLFEKWGITDSMNTLHGVQNFVRHFRKLATSIRDDLITCLISKDQSFRSFHQKREQAQEEAKLQAAQEEAKMKAAQEEAKQKAAQVTIAKNLEAATRARLVEFIGMVASRSINSNAINMWPAIIWQILHPVGTLPNCTTTQIAEICRTAKTLSLEQLDVPFLFMKSL